MGGICHYVPLSPCLLSVNQPGNVCLQLEVELVSISFL